MQSFDTTCNTTVSDREIETNGCECCPHCGPRKQLCDFCCDVGSLLLCGLSYLYSLGSKIPCPLFLSVDRERYKYSVKKNYKNKTGTCAERRGVGDTYITGGHIGGDTHITSDMCTGIHISRGYTYHCDTGNYESLFQVPVTI